MNDNLETPNLISDEDSECIREIFCMIAVGRDKEGKETEKHCKGILCSNCRFDKSNEKEFVAWFTIERMNGRFNII